MTKKRDKRSWHPKLDPKIVLSGEKRPRVPAEFEGESDTKRPAWRFGRADNGGPWPWRSLPAADLHDSIKKLADLEGMTWDQVRKAGSHHVPTGKLEKAARDRLVAIRRDDVDELFSIRCTGRTRIWGIKEHHIFHVLWFDPEHEVCPSEKKNT